MTPRARFFLAFVTLAAGAALMTFPQRRSVIVAGWTVVTLATGLGVFHGILRALLLRRDRSPFERALSVPVADPVRPRDLQAMERTHGLGAYEPRDFDHYVRSNLRRLILDRLARRHGLEPSRDRAPARARMGDELVELAGSRPAAELYERSLVTADLERIITDIERIR